jgi:hypothetical protein
MKGKKTVQRSVHIPAIFFLAILSMIFIVGCAQPPKQEMDAANAALTSAIGAGAEDYAPDQFKLAQDLIAKMNDQVQKKDYKGAKETAIMAREKSLEAKTTAEANQAKAKESAESTNAEVKQGIDKDKALIQEAESAGVPAVDLKTIKEQLSSVEAGSLEVDSFLTGKQYKDAGSKAGQLKDQLTQIETSITDAKAKFEASKAKKKGKKK